MPNHEEHCQASLRKYDKRFDELHSWMDGPSEILGKKHRMYRHDPEVTPKEAKKLFGENADNACLDYITLDKRENPERFDWHPRRYKEAGTCPRCGSTVVWRKANITGELYRGCTNFPRCKYHERSYKYTPENASKHNEWCFIATAAYGTPLAREVNTLRDLRDRRLNKNGFGQRLVATYYKISPPLAKAISSSQLRRKIVRVFLNPLVIIFKRLGYR